MIAFLACQCIQAGTLVKFFKFGAQRTMCIEVIHILLFTAKHSKWRPYRQILLIFDPKGAVHSGKQVT